MSFEVIDSLFTIKADGIMTVAMAAVILLIGSLSRARLNFWKNIVFQHLLLADSCLCLSLLLVM